MDRQEPTVRLSFKELMALALVQCVLNFYMMTPQKACTACAFFFSACSVVYAVKSFTQFSKQNRSEKSLMPVDVPEAPARVAYPVTVTLHNGKRVQGQIIVDKEESQHSKK